jgi:hypothetical protein
MVINLVKDEEPWIHHMKRLLACFTLPNNFFKISHARARLVLYDLLLPLQYVRSESESSVDVLTFHINI